MTDYILALDAGGTAVKSALYDARGAEIATAGEIMPPLRTAPGCNERAPEEMWRTICRTTRKAIAQSGVDPARIAVVGLTGYGNGLFLVDENAAPVRNAILSSDQRAAGVVERWRRQGLERAHLDFTGQKLWAGKPLPLLQWLAENEPETLGRAHRLLLCKDYLRLRLTGEAGLEITDLSSASLIRQDRRKWTPAVLELFGRGEFARLFGDACEPVALAGVVTASAAADMGLKAGAPVCAGVADNLGMAIAAGVLDERRLHMVSGTWGLNQLVTTSPGARGDILAAMFAARPGETLLVEGGANSASGFEWLVNVIVRDAPDREAAYAWCAAELARARESDPAVYFLPYLNGRPDAAGARAGFVGLSSWHGAPHMIRAVFEGVAFEHRENVERLLAGRGNPETVRFAGGAARSRAWLDIFAAVLNRPIELSPAKELGALGAAIVASVAVGLHRDLETAVAAMTRVKERIEPDPARVETMERRYRAFLRLRTALEPVWGDIAN